MVRPFRENESVEKLTSRQMLAMNLARLMEKSLDLQSNNALGKRAKVAHSHIRRILLEESAATVDMLDSIAAAFNIQAWELLVDDDTTKAAIMRRLFGGNPPNGEDQKPPPKGVPRRKKGDGNGKRDGAE